MREGEDREELLERLTSGLADRSESRNSWREYKGIPATED
jgi:hypothetical protein